MNNLILFISIFFLSSKLFSFEINQEVYLNACGSNPQVYSDKPLVLNNLKEVPNKITSLKKSEFDRDFKTRSESEMEFKGKTYKAQLDNFRNLKIFDHFGNSLAERKVSGATSIYEIFFKDEVIAWGVGWHKYEKPCKNDYYDKVDFTALRIFTPTEIDNKTVFESTVLSPSFSNVVFIENTSGPIIIDRGTIAGSAGVFDRHYSSLDFYGISDMGLTEYTEESELLNSNIQIDLIDADLYLHWLSRYSDPKRIQQFINNNYDEIIKTEIGEIILDEETTKYHKEKCLDNSYMISKLITENCFPSAEIGSNQFEMLMNTIYEEYYFSKNKNLIFEEKNMNTLNIYSTISNEKIKTIKLQDIGINNIAKFSNISFYEIYDNSFDVLYGDWGATENDLKLFNFMINGQVISPKDSKLDCRLFRDSQDNYEKKCYPAK